MRSFLTLLALPAFFLTSLASPIEESSALVERDAGTTAYADVVALYGQIKQYTGAINTTAHSLSSHSTAAQNASAQNVFIANIRSLTAAVRSTDATVLALPKVHARQNLTVELQDLARIVDDVVLEINGALQLVEDTLGLTQAILASLQPLVKALSVLIQDLDKVVDGIIEAVRALVDGALGGLSAALNGLVL